MRFLSDIRDSDVRPISSLDYLLKYPWTPLIDLFFMDGLAIVGITDPIFVGFWVLPKLTSTFHFPRMAIELKLPGYRQEASDGRPSRACPPLGQQAAG